MKRFGLTFIMLAFSVSLASAQPNIGVGWDDGYSVKIQTAVVGIQVTGKFDSSFPEDDDLDSETDADIAAYVSYPVLKADESNFNVFGGFSLLPTNRTTTVGTKSYDKELDFAFRLGIEPETMLTEHIGISGKAGLQIKLDQGYDGLDDSGSTDLGAWGSIGVHWFF